MNTELIAKTWDSLRAGHLDLIQSFYARFFKRYPGYRSLFPAQMDHHMRRMVDTMAMGSRLADHSDMIESRGCLPHCAPNAASILASAQTVAESNHGRYHG
jgi:hypothetical protein